MRALFLENPDITMPEAARALLMEELTSQTIRTLLDNTDRIDNEGPVIDKDLSSIEHGVFIYDF